MDFDPQKLSIGPMDFFSILLPGALLTYLLIGEGGPVVLRDRYAELAGAEAWATFLFASYHFGYLVFLLGYWLDEFFECVRDHRPCRFRFACIRSTMFGSVTLFESLRFDGGNSAAQVENQNQCRQARSRTGMSFS
jgi:hypothetical protein